METKSKELVILEEKTQSPDFWNNTEEAAQLNQKLFEVKREISVASSLKKDLQDIDELVALESPDFEKEVQERIELLDKKIGGHEFRIFLSGRYDRNNAILQITAGAGGVDAQDWATMVLRMYQRYCATKGFAVELLYQSFGEGGGPEGRIGTKSATIEIQGQYAYGFLKRESGVHRLVRISPFSAKKLRHTSFATVEIMPELEAEESLLIKPEDIRVEMYRASGPGGQNVNKRETAVRIEHVASGVVVTCQSERSQGQNKEKAMRILQSKLQILNERKKEEELKKMKKIPIGASWGSQIRSYVLHPYKMVKDLRTNIETSQVEKVLDGDLEQFIQTEIKEIND